MAHRLHHGWTVSFRQFLSSILEIFFGNIIATFLIDICKLKSLPTTDTVVCHHLSHHCSPNSRSPFIQDHDHARWTDDVFNLCFRTFNCLRNVRLYGGLGVKKAMSCRVPIPRGSRILGNHQLWISGMKVITSRSGVMFFEEQIWQHFQHLHLWFLLNHLDWNHSRVVAWLCSKFAGNPTLTRLIETLLFFSLADCIFNCIWAAWYLLLHLWRQHFVLLTHYIHFPLTCSCHQYFYWTSTDI